MQGKLYKNSMGNWLAQTLFYETWVLMAPERKLAQKPVFSFDRDIDGLINCKDTFVEIGDPTGYEWAMKYLHSYEHWELLNTRPWFLAELDKWKDELLAKIKAQAIQRIKQISTSEQNEAQSLAASKYLAERGWEKSGRGRPTKEELKGELKKLTKDIDQTEEDLKRIGLKVIEGGK